MIVHQPSCNLLASAPSGRVVGPYLGLYSQTDAAFRMNAPGPWGCGVMDSTGGFEPLNPGSIPGTFTGLGIHTGYSVVDIMADCDVANPGSNPGTPTKLQIWRKMKRKKIRKG